MDSLTEEEAVGSLNVEGVALGEEDVVDHLHPLHQLPSTLDCNNPKLAI